MGYTGEFEDSNGLIYLRARFYDPSMGRFLSTDPSRLEMNPYQYALGNPVMYIDPTGLRTWEDVQADFQSLTQAVGGAISTAAQNTWLYVTDKECRKVMNQNAANAFFSNTLAAAEAAQNLKNDFLNGCPRCTTDPQAIMQDYGTLFGYSFSVAFTVLDIADLVVPTGAVINWAWKKIAHEAAEEAAEQGIKYGVREIAEQGARQYGDNVFRAADNYVDNALGGCFRSFEGDTPVETDDGSVPIEDIEEGEYVLAYNEETGELGYYPVLAVWAHVDDNILHLTIDGETIVTTTDHPFYTADGEWVEAGDLEVGDAVLQADGTAGEVDAREVVDGDLLVYNFTVAEAHTYFVGDGQNLVHNTCFGSGYSDNMFEAARAGSQGVGDDIITVLFGRESGAWMWDELYPAGSPLHYPPKPRGAETLSLPHPDMLYPGLRLVEADGVLQVVVADLDIAAFLRLDSSLPHGATVMYTEGLLGSPDLYQNFQKAFHDNYHFADLIQHGDNLSGRVAGISGAFRADPSSAVFLFNQGEYLGQGQYFDVVRNLLTPEELRAYFP